MYNTPHTENPKCFTNGAARLLAEVTQGRGEWHLKRFSDPLPHPKQGSTLLPLPHKLKHRGKNPFLKQPAGAQQQSPDITMGSLCYMEGGHSEPGRNKVNFKKNLSVLTNLWASKNVRKMLCAFSGQAGLRCSTSLFLGTDRE